jgi:hypothetical protein
MKYFYFLAFIPFVFSSCTKEKEPKPEPTSSAPEKAVLSFPAQNEACTTGSVISATQSRITLKWQASANTNSYEVNIKDLLTGVWVNLPATQPELEVTLLRNTPYSWFVTSKSSAVTATAQSNTWKFYNAGPGAVTYAPYPAEIVAPVMGQVLNSGIAKVKLEWRGSDVESDISSYDIFLGTGEPVLIASNVTNSFLADVPLSDKTTYYWKVISKDSKGNTSDSGIYQFKVN